MTIAVVYNGSSSQTSGGAEQILGNSGAAIVLAGVFQLSIDVNLLANAATPDLAALHGHPRYQALLQAL